MKNGTFLLRSVNGLFLLRTVCFYYERYVFYCERCAFITNGPFLLRAVHFYYERYPSPSKALKFHFRQLKKNIKTNAKKNKNENKNRKTSVLVYCCQHPSAATGHCCCYKCCCCCLCCCCCCFLVLLLLLLVLLMLMKIQPDGSQTVPILDQLGSQVGPILDQPGVGGHHPFLRWMIRGRRWQHRCIPGDIVETAKPLFFYWTKMQI